VGALRRPYCSAEDCFYSCTCRCTGAHVGGASGASRPSARTLWDPCYRRKDGRWVGQYLVYLPSGPKYHYIYGKTRKDVSVKLTKAMADRDKGIVFDDENLTLSDFLGTWLSDCVRGTIRESTFERYESIVQLHITPALGRLRLKALNPARVQSFYRDRLDSGLSPATVQKIHVVLHKALKQAVKWSLIPRNVTEAVTVPRPAPQEMRPLSVDEVRRFLQAASDEPLEALYVLAVHTGMRQGELLALKWNDVDLEAGAVSVRRTLSRVNGHYRLGEPKTKKSRRTVKLTGAAVEALRKHLSRQMEDMERLGDLYRDQELVFASGSGGILNPSNLRQRSFNKLLKKAELPEIRFHDLRHTCATLLSRNVHPKIVQETLGYANVAITLDTYSHVLPGMGDKATSAMEDVLL
jgi:integrase